MSSNVKKLLYTMPVPSTEFDAYMDRGTIRYEYHRDDGLLYRSGIQFNQMPAMRKRSERCCTLWHIEGVYDTLVEVEASPWVEEIRADTNEYWRYKWEMHHYMIYLDSAGCFEVIAASWDVLPEEVGSWSKTQAT